MKNYVAIICEGDPAPGINTVVSTVAKVFLDDGYRVLGVYEGYKGLFSDNPEIKEFDFDQFLENPDDYNFNKILEWEA